MHMVHSIINGKPASPVNFGGSGGGDDEEEDDRKHHRHLASMSPKITTKGQSSDESKDELIKKIMAENAQLAEQLGNKKA